jgi:hypothetical protein
MKNAENPPVITEKRISLSCFTNWQCTYNRYQMSAHASGKNEQRRCFPPMWTWQAPSSDRRPVNNVGRFGIIAGIFPALSAKSAASARAGALIIYGVENLLS